jgi:bis(5'-nucleosyl)-tetraphosphatase (symmetrical)
MISGNRISFIHFTGFNVPTYVIGDIQGCAGQLDLLIDRIHAVSSSPRFIFAGDLVNRGPDSLGALRTIRSLGTSARVVLGNHDLHLLAVANGIRKPSRSDTLDTLLTAPDREEWMDWLRRQPLALFEQDHLIVHAGVLSAWTAEKTLALAHEVEAVLRDKHWTDFFGQMYGNTPAKWDDSLQGADRLRCIVNALTRMRYCQADGTMELELKEDVPQHRPDLMPWFDVPGRLTENVTVVFGHWSMLGLILRPNLIGLDTGCVWGGKLTAIRLEDRSLVQVDCPQHRKPG